MRTPFSHQLKKKASKSQRSTGRFAIINSMGEVYYEERLRYLQIIIMVSRTLSSSSGSGALGLGHSYEQGLLIRDEHEHTLDSKKINDLLYSSSRSFYRGCVSSD